jgi:predicted Rossmann fold flavoprotein
MENITIVGGGPAGFMAAISAAEAARGGSAVRILSRGSPLHTLLRTGGGRCNLTNAAGSPRELASSYPRGAKLLLSAFTRFGAMETMEWFRSRGLPLSVEEGGRVFPASRRAADVRELLMELARKNGVEITADAAVSSARVIPGGFELETTLGIMRCGILVVATGGGRSPDGVGCSLARALGHSVTPLAPSLAALITRDPWPGSLAGLSLIDARIRAVFEGRDAADERGDLVFTHSGISGPLAFRISSRAAYIPFSAGSPLECVLSAAPDLTATAIEAVLTEFFASRPRASAVSGLRKALPKSLAEAVFGLAGLDPETPCSRVKRGERRALARLAAGTPLAVVSREPGGEIVTAGGVSLDQIGQKTMASRLVPGLFFCGEVLDIDGFTGGFNLQACWTTGRLAGLGAAGALAERS